MELISLVFGLLIFFQLKHLIADYFLQTKYMLGKFKPGWDFLLPLLAHVGVHGTLTLGIVLLVAPHLWWLCLVDMIIHFFMDRVKAGPKYLGRFKAVSGDEFRQYTQIIENKDMSGNEFASEYAEKMLRHNVYYWVALGFDQMIHHLTDLYIVYVLVMNSILG